MSEGNPDQACECLSKNLSVTWLSREDARTFGLRAPTRQEGPWCFRCGRARGPAIVREPEKPG